MPCLLLILAFLTPRLAGEFCSEWAPGQKFFENFHLDFPVSVHPRSRHPPSDRESALPRHDGYPSKPLFRLRLQCPWNPHSGRAVVPAVRSLAQSDDCRRRDESEFGFGHQQRIAVAKIEVVNQLLLTVY